MSLMTFESYFPKGNIKAINDLNGFEYGKYKQCHKQ